MTDNSGTLPASRRSGLPSWAVKAIAVAVVAVLAVIAYFILAAFLPRWWAQRIGAAASSSLTAGSALGVGLGVVCTVVSLLLLAAAWRARRWRKARVWLGGLVVLAVVASIPNLLTLAIVAGGGSGAHAGERILDVEAPGFRAATLIGVILGALIFAAVGVLGWRFGRHRRLAKANA